MTTPREAGFRMPPEWAPHAGCWMAWPCRPENWDDIEAARATYVEVARAISGFEPVTMTANQGDAGAARRALTGVTDTDVVVVPSDESWARDTAPTFVTDGRGALGGLTAALDPDNTGGHVDNLACFAAPGVVVALGCADRDDPQYAAVQENLARLRAATDARGRALEVVELPMPARPESRGRRLSPSYVNFYLANGAVVMPAFGDQADAAARGIMARLFPRRTVIEVPTLELAKADGNVHCVTQQQPVA